MAVGRINDFLIRLGFSKCAVGCINEVTALTGFSYEEIHGRFAGKNVGQN